MDTHKNEFKATPLKAFLTFLLIIVLFGLAFQFEAKMGEMGPTNDIESLTILDIFQKYYLFAGLVFGFVSAIIFLVLNLFKKFAKKYLRYYYYGSIALSVLPWYFFARQLVFHEPRNADYAKAIISYLGYPLLATTKFLFGLLLVIFVLSTLFRYAKGKFFPKAHVLLILMSPLLLTACLGGTAGLACFLLPESDHCYQAAAIQENDPEVCAKISGEGFEGENPPKDKCYLRIAENTGDLSVCDNIEGGMFSYSKEECYLNTSIKFEDPSGCLKLSGADKNTCVSKVSPSITPGKVLEMDEQIKLLKEELSKNPDPELQTQLTGLEQKRADNLAVMSSENKKSYEETTDPLNIAAQEDYYNGTIDEKTKNSLVELNNRFREQGNSMSEKEYKALRDVLAYKNDPKNNIENMDDNEIVKLRWNEKLSNGVEFFKFWKANNTTKEEQYDEQLLFYERMLERQKAIDKGMSESQQDFDRNYGMLKDKIKGDITTAVMDEAKKQAFGQLLDIVASDAESPVTTVLGEAIDVVKAEAKSKEFRGMVRAYNLGMEDELANNGGDVERAHAAVVATMTKNPYEYEDQNTFAKYGNLLENKDCDGSNPHCLNKDIFWKAMKKSYKYQQAKK